MPAKIVVAVAACFTLAFFCVSTCANALAPTCFFRPFTLFIPIPVFLVCPSFWSTTTSWLNSHSPNLEFYPHDLFLSTKKSGSVLKFARCLPASLPLSRKAEGRLSYIHSWHSKASSYQNRSRMSLEFACEFFLRRTLLRD